MRTQTTRASSRWRGTSSADVII